MQPESQHPDIQRDPFLDGRDSLRLVKLRLALTLIAVAVLPIAAVSPLVRAAADEARMAHHERLADQAAMAANQLQREIQAIQTASRTMLADPAIVAAFAPNAPAKVRKAAAERLGDLAIGPEGSIVGVSLLTADGVAVAVGARPPGGVDAKELRTAGLVPLPGSGDVHLLVVETSGQGAKEPRIIVSTVSMSALLAATFPNAEMPGRQLLVTDLSGAVQARFHDPFDPSTLPGEVLDVTTMPTRDDDGRATIQLPGIQGWQVVVSAPMPLVSLPIPALVALGVTLVALMLFTFWMAHQILRPATRLEASRSHLRELYESAREAALRDSLTGLGNHRAFQEAVARMVEGARRYGTSFSLVLIDVDEFKRVNDTRGHAVGDQLLAEVGSIISSTIRISDAAFRVGGDEFAILLPHTDVGGATILARRLLSLGLEDRVRGEYRAPISFSAGVTSCPEFGTTRLELTAQADAALYRGKRAGRTVVTIYEPEKDHGHVDEGMRAELSSAISAVIENRSLTPVYQPIVDLVTGRVTGYEGLVRVPRESTFAHAGAMFDAAEVAGRVQDLDRAALDVVLRGAVGLEEGVTLSVNVSPRTLESAEFSAGAFLAMLRRHGRPPGAVILELTEREAIRDPKRLNMALLGVQAAGVRVAADDVGAGNAGLRLLSQFRFDVVKIDLSLVQRAGDDTTHSVLGSIVDMANRLGATTIAEGVETSEQLRTARRLGITAGQGYLLGRPGPDRDLPWVDLTALEQGDDLAIPHAGERPDRRVEPIRWDPIPESRQDAGPAPARGPLAQVRRSMTALKSANRRTDE